jgi:predicted DNA-binding protein
MRVSSIRLPADLDNRLQLLTYKTGRLRVFFIRKALELTIDELERVYVNEQIQPDPSRIGPVKVEHHD